VFDEGNSSELNFKQHVISVAVVSCGTHPFSKSHKVSFIESKIFPLRVSRALYKV
jgi:hypothetical protein